MRWILRLVGVLVFMVVVAVAALFLIPADRIANLAARQFEAATGRALAITGDVSPRVWPEIGASLEGVTLANADWSDTPQMAQIGRVDVGVDLVALIGGSIVVRNFEIADAELLLERDAQGRANWEFGTGEAAGDEGTAQQGDGLPAIVLDRASITNLTLRYVDHVSGTRQTLEELDAVLQMPDAQGPAVLNLTARPGGTPLNAELSLGSVTGFLNGAVTPLRAELSLDGAAVQFEGRVGLDPLALDGALSLDAARLAPAMALVVQGGAEPLPEGARPLTLGGQVTLAPAGSLHLRNGVLGLGTNRIRASLDLLLDGERPNLTGEIAADALDLRPLLGGGESSAGGTGWPTDRIDASALGLVDARVGLATGPVQTGVADIDALRGVLTIDNARAVLSLSEVRAWQGVLSGDLIANNRSGLSVRAALALRDVNLQPMLVQMADFERLSGSAAMDLDILGSGSSVDAIMRSLDGEGRIEFGAGEIRGLDLAGMLRNLDASYVGEGNSTIYDSITGSFTISDGVLRNEDLRLEAPLVGVVGTGTVDLGAQALDYRVTPEALRNAETGDALRVPPLITGPWSAPRFRLDLEGLAEQRLAEERARLEARAREEAARLEEQARQRAQERVEEELGVTPEEGESVEDTLRRGLQERLLRGLVGGADETVPTQETAPDQ